VIASINHRRFYSVKQAADFLSVHPHTVRSWTDTGRLNSIRLDNGYRRIPHEAIESFLRVNGEGEEEAPPEDTQSCQKRICIVARVSSQKQRGDLERQRERLERHVAERHPNAQVAIKSHCRSGVNVSHPLLHQLCREILEGKYTHVVCWYSCRLARLGFDLIKLMCDHVGCQIEVVDKRDIADTDEGMKEIFEDCMNLLCSYTSRINGEKYARLHKRELSPENLKTIWQMKIAGHSQRHILQWMKDNDIRCEKTGKKVCAAGVLNRILKEQGPMLEKLYGTEATARTPLDQCFDKWFSLSVKKGDESARLDRQEAYESYETYCDQHKQQKQSRIKFYAQLMKACGNPPIKELDGSRRRLVGFTLA